MPTRKKYHTPVMRYRKFKGYIIVDGIVSQKRFKNLTQARQYYKKYHRTNPKFKLI